MHVLTPAQMEQLVRYANKSTGWILIASGAFLVALKETWLPKEIYDWPVPVYVLVVVLMLVACALFTLVRQRRTHDIMAQPGRWFGVVAGLSPGIPAPVLAACRRRDHRATRSFCGRAADGGPARTAIAGSRRTHSHCRADSAGGPGDRARKRRAPSGVPVPPSALRQPRLGICQQARQAGRSPSLHRPETLAGCARDRRGVPGK